jgi:hypothetical protein
MIENSIPQLLHLLKDGNWEVRVAGANVMIQLAEHSEFPPISSVWCRYSTFQAKLCAVIETTVPQLLHLLQDNDPDVQDAGTNLFVKLAERSEFRTILSPSLLK